MTLLHTLLHDYLFLIPLVVLLLSEILKISIEGFRTGQWHTKLFHPGGMPSTHSAFVTSLLIVIWRKVGIESPEFAIAFTFACYVWYDAVGVRHRLGEQAHILNKLQHRVKLTEQFGHSIKQVIAGIWFGAFITAIGVWISDSELYAFLV